MASGERGEYQDPRVMMGMMELMDIEENQVRHQLLYSFEPTNPQYPSSTLSVYCSYQQVHLVPGGRTVFPDSQDGQEVLEQMEHRERWDLPV